MVHVVSVKQKTATQKEEGSMAWRAATTAAATPTLMAGQAELSSLGTLASGLYYEAGLSLIEACPF